MSDFKKRASNSLLGLADKPEEGLAFLMSTGGEWSLFPKGCMVSLVDADGVAWPYVLQAVSRRELKLRCACHRPGCTRLAVFKASFKGEHPSRDS